MPPEGPELRLMADFLNQHANKICLGTAKSAVTKIITPDIKCNAIFLGAKSRGKELMLSFKYEEHITKYSFSMGMSGNWMIADHSDIVPKHAHFVINLFPEIIYMVDPRRFAKWKIVNDWNRNRSPDLYLEPHVWQKYFLKEIQTPDLKTIKSKYISIPICELLMNQKLFNGVGNYIRAEVLYRADINPFETIQNINLNYLHKVIRDVMEEAYNVGGSEISAFKNPNNKEQQNKGDWQVCYRKSGMNQWDDRQGRTLWYNCKWNNPYVHQIIKIN